MHTKAAKFLRENSSQEAYWMQAKKEKNCIKNNSQEDFQLTDLIK